MYQFSLFLDQILKLKYMLEYKMVESGLTHVLHSCVITAVLYILMLFVLKQSPAVAETNSLALGASALSYMLIFGHKLPPTLASWLH